YSRFPTVTSEDGSRSTAEEIRDDQGWLRQGKRSDPAIVVECQEMIGHFHQIVGQLDDTGRRLVEGLMAGLRLGAVAARMNISYDAAKRRWRQLRNALAIRLSDSHECLAANVA